MICEFLAIYDIYHWVLKWAKLSLRALLNSISDTLEYLILQLLDPMLAIRLISIGIYPGKVIKLIRKAPWGGCYYVQVDQSFFALRKNEWETIITKPMDLK